MKNNAAPRPTEPGFIGEFSASSSVSVVSRPDGVAERENLLTRALLFFLQNYDYLIFLGGKGCCKTTDHKLSVALFGPGASGRQAGTTAAGLGW